MIEDGKKKDDISDYFIFTELPECCEEGNCQTYKITEHQLELIKMSVHHGKMSRDCLGKSLKILKNLGYDTMSLEGDD